MDLGDIAHDQGNLALAVERYRRCLDQTGERGDMRLVADALAGIGSAALGWGQARPAALLMAAADALRERVGTEILLPLDRATYERNRETLRRALGEEAFARTWADGRRHTLAQAVALATSVLPAPLPARAPAGPPRSGLTRRQLDVLRLMATWQTDREIAEALFISPSTASWHVRAILEKLGVASRRDAVARAHAEGWV
jgi:DNA-binding CsgD family transcriptional regulator